MNSAQCAPLGVEPNMSSREQHLRSSSGSGVNTSGTRITRMSQSPLSAPARISRNMTMVTMSAASAIRTQGGQDMATGCVLASMSGVCNTVWCWGGCGTDRAVLA